MVVNNKTFKPKTKALLFRKSQLKEEENSTFYDRF